MKTITFSAPIAPVPKGRPRFGKGRTYTPKSTVAFEKAIASYARAAYRGKPLQSRLSASIDLYFPIPESWRKSKREAARLGLLDHTIAADVDNCAKSALDALNGIIYADDRQIVVLRARKLYGAPLVVIRVEEV